MAETTRFGVSIEAALLRDFDRLCAAHGYANRSEALRDLMRGALARHAAELGDAQTAGTLTLVYDHHKSDVAKKLTEAQHHAPVHVAAALHVHLDHNACLEVIVLRGQGRLIREFAQKLLAIKGVAHGELHLAGIV